MSVAPVTETGAKRRIGDILLELGFVSEDALAGAAEEQERTGQPLGQILVNQGVITRLELASALAEQWSEHASITPLPVPSALPRPAPQQQPHDEDQYAARLQAAVADLTQRVHTAQPEEGFETRVTELAQRIEATVARTQRLEVTMATLAESLEGVTGGVEEAFGVLQSGMSGLALDLARIDTTVAELLTRPSGPTPEAEALEARLEELRRAVRELDERSPVDEEARSRVDEIVARVEDLGAGEAVAEELEAQRAVLGELRSAVAELEARPTGSEEVDSRLARVETELAERLAALPTAADVEALTGRLEVTAAAQEGLRASLDDLRGGLEELSRRDVPDSSWKIEALEARLEALASGLEELRRAAAEQPATDVDAVVGELRSAVDTLGQEVATLASERPADVSGQVAEAAERLEELGRAVGGHASLAERLEALEHRLHAGYVTSDDLSQALEQAREELRPGPPAPDPRVEELARDIGALRAELARAHATPPEELRALAERVEQIAHEQGPLEDPRVDRLAHDFDTVRDELARLRAAPASGPDLTHELAALAGRVEQLDRDRDDRQALGLELEALQSRLAGLVTPGELEQALARAREESASTAPVPDESLTRALGLLAERIAAVESIAAATAAVRPPDTSEIESAVAALGTRLAGLESLGERVEALAGSVAAVSAPQQDVVTGLRGELDERLAELTRTLEERFAAAGTQESSRGRSLDEGIEDELERTRMAIERLSLHLGEHDRALAEMRGSRSLTQRVDELSARIDDLAAAGPAAAAEPSGAEGRGERNVRRSLEPDIEMRSLIRRLEDVEEAATVGREKLMNRLERMASSIDWRLQRLEAGETE